MHRGKAILMKKMTREQVSAIGDKAWEEFTDFADQKGVKELLAMLPDHFTQLAKAAMRSGVAYGLKYARDHAKDETLQ